MSAQRQGLRSIAASLPSVTKPALAKRGFGAARLIADWPTIVGPVLAASSLPERMVRDRNAETATLVIKISPGVALELQHLEPQVIERINSHYGFRAVTKLRLVQGPLPLRPARAAPVSRPLDANRLSQIEASLAPLADSELRQALLDLGRQVAGRPRDPSK
jgi:hypothetical protein